MAVPTLIFIRKYEKENGNGERFSESEKYNVRTVRGRTAFI
jgi:hypothetical protein